MVEILKRIFDNMEIQEIENRINEITGKYKADWKGKRIAILEDDPDQQELLELMIDTIAGKNNTTIKKYNSSPAHIDGLNDGDKVFDLIIVDGDLRGHETGSQGIKRLNDRELKIIARTGSETELSEFKNEGVDLAIFKRVGSRDAFWDEMKQIASIFQNYKE